jgi:lysophospholipase L1-like esterase
MFTASHRYLTAGLVLAGLIAPILAADDKANPAVAPLNRDIPRHKQFLKIVANGEGDVIFLGDSITHGWESTGKKVWAETFAPLKAVNLGIGGDQTGHVLWRITEGKELEPLKPRAAVIMIGTNNIPRNHTPEQIAGGVKAIVEELRKQKPHIKILVLGVFPRSGKKVEKTVSQISTADLQPKVKEINAILARLDDGKMVFFKDIGGKFLDKDGGLSRKIMPDYLHLSPQGYQIWADAIKADVEKLVKQ